MKPILTILSMIFLAASCPDCPTHDPTVCDTLVFHDSTVYDTNWVDQINWINDTIWIDQIHWIEKDTTIYNYVDTVHVNCDTFIIQVPVPVPIPCDPCPCDTSCPQEANYYVSVNGNDNNPGTKDRPLATIQTAYNKCPEGGIIEVMAGEYVSSSTILVANKNNITVRSNGALLRGNTGYVVNISGHRNTIDGFKITGASYAGIIIYSNYNTIKNCEIYENVKAGRSGGIYTTKNNPLWGNSFIGNHIHDNGQPGSNLYDHGLYLNCDSATIAYNVIENNSSYGIQLSQFNTGVKVHNNIIRNNRYGGIGMFDTIKDTDINDNEIYGNLNAFICWSMVAQNVRVFNNKIQGPIHSSCNVCNFYDNDN